MLCIFFVLKGDIGTHSSPSVDDALHCDDVLGCQVDRHDRLLILSF